MSNLMRFKIYRFEILIILIQFISQIVCILISLSFINNVYVRCVLFSTLTTDLNIYKNGVTMKNILFIMSCELLKT